MGKLDFVNIFLKKVGFSLEHYSVASNSLLRRKAIFENYRISDLLDVGANKGLYAKEAREMGYKGRIHSFEPLEQAFSKLKSAASKDETWDVFNFALGAEHSENEINVSSNSHSSSILDILDTHTKAEESASYVGKQKIKVVKLDAIFSDLKKKGSEIFLKIDTQGYELNVLKGAEETLQHINTIQLEMSVVPLYSEQALYDELLKYLWQRDYRLIDVDPGFVDQKNGSMMQFDAIFRRK